MVSSFWRRRWPIGPLVFPGVLLFRYPIVLKREKWEPTLKPSKWKRACPRSSELLEECQELHGNLEERLGGTERYQMVSEAVDVLDRIMEPSPVDELQSVDFGS